MVVDSDVSVRDIGNTMVTLRDDLVVLPRCGEADPHYLLQCPLTSTFFRMGVTEFTFASFLDGQTTIAGALKRLAGVDPAHELLPPDGVAICHWLVESKLASTPASRTGERLAADGQVSECRRALQRLNPLVIKVPLGSPDRFLERLTPWVAWLHSPLGLAAWAVLLLIAGFRVAAHWTAFTEAAGAIFSPGQWLWLGAGWLLLKLVHELGHGIVCKKYGGHVREAGILFVVLAPLAYVDLTSCWRFPSRWQRIHTALAGMQMELLVAAIGALLWQPTGAAHPLNHLCVHLAMMASFTTLAFNANPLVKFDGYYVFSDLVGIPNLSVRGRQWLYGLGRQFLVGVPRRQCASTPGRSLIIGIYAVLAMLWRTLVTISLLLGAAWLFHGAGILLAGLGVICWLGFPAYRFARYLSAGRPGEQPKLLRFSGACGLGGALLIALWTCVPWPGAARAPAIVSYGTDMSVRAATPGFVEEIHVDNGQRVTLGQPLMRLVNRELTTALADLKLEIEQAKASCRVHQQRQQLAAYQAELERLATLRRQFDERRAEADGLTIRAGKSGTLIAPQLSFASGTYVAAGDELGVIGSDGDKSLQVSIAQDDLAAFDVRPGQSVSVIFPHHTRMCGRWEEVDPRASSQPSDPAFCAVNRGPLAVRREQPSRQADQAGADSLAYLAPRFVGRVTLSEADQGRLACGQLGTVVRYPYDETVGEHLIRRGQAWLTGLRDRAQQRE